jgi:hypothetical protein
VGSHAPSFLAPSFFPRRHEVGDVQLGRLAAYPVGPIFRTERGSQWTNATLCARFTSIKRATNRVTEKKGLPAIRKQVTAYAYRHAFVTRWVQQGKPLSRLCELLNTSEAMIREHYNHLFEQPDTLRESLDEFVQDTDAQLAKVTVPEPQTVPSGLRDRLRQHLNFSRPCFLTHPSGSPRGNQA